MTIFARGKSQIYTAEFSDHGVHRRVSLDTRSKKTAMGRALQLEVRLAGGEAHQPKLKAITVSQAVQEYLDTKRLDNRAPRTLNKYGNELTNFAIFAARHGAGNLNQISARLFDQYRASRKAGRSEKSLYTEAIIIKGFVKWCLNREFIPRDPLRGCRLTKPPLIPKTAPTLEQINILLENASTERRVQFAILAFTGMRSGELKMLRSCDVDLEGGWVHVVAREG